MLCEAAAYYKKQGLTLWDQMLKIYEKYGYFRETLVSLERKGVEGVAEIQAMLEKLRNNPPAEIGGYKVLEFRDYEKDIVKRADGSTMAQQVFLNPMFSILTLKTMHGAVQMTFRNRTKG